MEFSVSTDLSKIQPNRIESNVSEVKTWLISALDPYKNMVVSEDAIASAKTDRANINKLRKAIDDKRKTVKKQWVAPYIEWEKQVNELIELCDGTAGNLDVQIKRFEDQAKTSKREELEDYFDTLDDSTHLGAFITFESIFNPKWLNATTKIESAKAEIDVIIKTVIEDIKTIRDLESDFETELLSEYKRSRDIRAVLQKEKELKAFRERQRQLEEQKQKEVQTTLPEVENATGSSQNSFQSIPEPTAPEKAKEEPAYDLLLQLRLTKAQAKWLKAVMEQQGIKIVQSKMKEYKA